MLSSLPKNLSPGIRRAVTNTGWLFFDRVFRMGAAVVVGLAVARYLGPKQYGEFNFAIAFVALFASFSTLGLDNLVVRYLVSTPEDSDAILGTATCLRLAGTVVSCFAIMTMVCVLRPGQPLMAWLVALNAASLLPQVLSTIELYFQAHVASKYTVWGRTLAFAITAGLRLLLVAVHAPLVAFAWAAFLEAVLGAAAIWIACRFQEMKLSRWRFDSSLARRLLLESWPLILSGMVIMIYMRLDQVMLGQMKGDYAVGIYSAAVRLSEVWYFIPTAVVTTIFPTIVRSREISRDLYIRRNQLLFEAMALSAYSLAIPITFISRKIMSGLLGMQYIEASSILSLHVWTGLFVFIGVAQSPWMLAEKLTRFSFVTTAAGAVVNVVLNLILIPRRGAMGAAIATVVAQFVASYAANGLFTKTRPIFWMQTRALFLISTIQWIARVATPKPKGQLDQTQWN